MTTYDETFYNVINDGSLRSARTVVPDIMSAIQPKTVIDFGCGEGAWLSVFKEHGAQVLGVDGTYVDRKRLLIDDTEFLAYNLGDVAELNVGHSDLAISLEVAEHLPESRADWFVRTLTEHADVILFSAAIPGQGGTNHVNEQWPSYWAQKFWENNYEFSMALRWRYWDLPVEAIEPWYAQNLAIAWKWKLALPEHLIGTGVSRHNHAAVHPAFWDSRR